MRTTLLRLFVATMAIVLFGSCTHPTMQLDKASVWIAAYSPDQVDMDSRIRIEATDSLMSLLDTLNIPDKVFSFSPSIKGEVVYTQDGRYIDFIPREGAMKQGKQYTCRVDISALTGIEGLHDFAFDFRVGRREVMFRDVKVSIDPDNAGLATVDGVLYFSFISGDIPVDASMITCNAEGATIQINPTEEKLKYSFRISGILRKETEAGYNIEFNPLAGFSKASTEVTIPGVAEFKLLNVERHEAVQPYLELEFSSPLDESQNLDGLVTIDGIDQLRIERNGANVKVFYPNNAIQNMVLQVSELIRANDGRALKGDIEQLIKQEVISPAVEIPLSGTILPDNRNLTLPFRAVNLAAVDVEVVKIYTDNILTFLQDNNMDETSSIRRVGRLIHRETVRLDKDKSLNLHQWQNFSIDLKNLFRKERGAIYSIRLSFCKEYSLYDRTEAVPFEPQNGITDEDEAIWDTPSPYISRSSYSWSRYRWKESDDPTKDSYYMVSSRMPEYNLAASDIGLIVKRADSGQLWCTVSDIVTTSPLNGVRIVAYNYQMREIGAAYSNDQGFASFRTEGTPFVVTAGDGISTTYLKINGGKELSTSNFNVSGQRSKQGVKGFVYGERGVWRPGDDIYLTLMVEDKQHALPDNHPVTMEFCTPDDQLYDRQTLTKGIDGIYTFRTRTSDDAPTGLWRARFKIGGETLLHTVRIETITPNRLKINISAPKVLQSDQKSDIGIESHWLTGPAASNLRVGMEISLYRDPRPFKKYSDYIFANPIYSLQRANHRILEGTLDSLGRISKPVIIPYTKQAPGMMRANIIARVEETGGNESITSESVKYSPYTSYVGIQLGEKEFETDCDLKFPVVAVDSYGRALSGRTLEYKIYRLDWGWWQEGSASALNRYVESRSADIVASGELKTSTDGKAEIPFRIDYPSWGKYLVYVRDTRSCHATGGEIYIDWPHWRGHSGKSNPKAATMLSFALDRKNYEVGDVATVYLPQSQKGRVLLSVETGSRVVSQCWVSLSADKETAYKLPVTKDMAPNFYVHATLLQPHAQTANDLPIRMYGVEGAEVINRRSILHPQIEVADEILPQQEFTVRISEQENKPMSYTLAIVDEGLLDITSFKTPQPWQAMNRREALGVTTWDIYDDVIGAFGGKFASILSVGGDEAIRAGVGKEKRFNPVVKFMGPFTLKGGSRTHKVTLPMYVGSVRVMVVAAHDGSYGNADKTVTVRAPLMVLPTLPRTLACGDKVQLPVNVFVTDKALGEVTVDIKTEGPVSVIGGRTRTLNFSAEGEQLTNFELQCDKLVSGTAKITISARGGDHSVNQTINIGVRNPQPTIVKVETRDIGEGKKERFEWDKSSNGTVSMEIATMPAINFSGAFSFVENYSHYCTEQLSSRAMYILYARRFLNDSEKKKAEKILPDLLKAIMSRQLPNGGFAYWPNYTIAHEWVTSMAGEVMTEARRQGFTINREAFDSWVEYQREAARNYHHTTEHAADLVQAYRLYTLALAGEASTAAMNKLRESKSLSRQALMRLAAAYAVSGRNDVAAKLIDRADDATRTGGSYATFYSPLRDMAMEIETWALLGDGSRATTAARKVVEEFKPDYCSTQEVAFTSIAMSRLADMMSSGSNEIVISESGRAPLTLRSIQGVKNLSLNTSSKSVKVENRSKGNISASLTVSRTPAADEIIPSTADGVAIKVSYTDLTGRDIAIDQLKQGEEFIAHIEVKKSVADSESMALTFATASGWEIWNERLMNQKSNNELKNLDIRDDRISWYFGMRDGEARKFSIRLRAAWCGSYTLPATVCEDMYDARCRAIISNRRVEVVK